MLKKNWSLDIVSRKDAQEVMSSKTRRINPETKTPYVDEVPALFIKSGNFTGEAIAFDNDNAVIWKFDMVEVEEEVKP